MGADLDQWLPQPAVRSRHEREARAGADALWEAARGIRLADCRLLGRLVSLRLADVRRESSFDALFRAAPFVLLDEGPRHAISGLCGRIWLPRRELARLEGPAAFRAWRAPGTARVLFAHWVEETPSGARIASEVRVSPVDRRAALALRALEPFITAFQGLVGRESLALAVRRAEDGAATSAR